MVYSSSHQPSALDLAQTPCCNFIQALPDATLIINTQGVIIFANQQVSKIFGYTIAELTNAPLGTLMPEQYRQGHLQHLRAYFSQPHARSMGTGLHLQAQHKTGSVFPVEISLSPIETQQGIAVICCIRDISIQKRAEAALLNDERFQLFLRYTPSAIAMFDTEMRYLIVSRRWLEDYQLKEQDIIGISHYAVFPEIPSHWKAIHQRCLAGETLQSEEEVFLRPNGRKDYVRWQCLPWHSKHGQIGGIILFTEVITGRKRMEIERQQSEARFHGIFDNAVTGIAMTDWQGHFQQCNAAYCDLLGYSLEELQKLTFAALIHPDDVQTNLNKVAALRLKKISHFDIENRYIKKNGEIIWVRKFISTLPDETGQPTYLLAIVSDVTQLKYAEIALTNTLQNLEQQVQERTQALQDAKKQADQANAFKSRFLAAASHDLRQPLQSVELYLTLLTQQLNSPQHQLICNAMQQSLETMSDLMNTLLDISKLDSGTITPNKTDFCLQDLFDRLINNNQKQAEAQGLQLYCQPVTCWVHSDTALLERILDNLIANAIHYTQQGNITLSCNCTDAQAHITITDTGIGIPSHELTNIFDAYYQLNNPERNRNKGLGLGLAIVKQLSQLLDHSLHVKSTLGQGSVFTLEVPLGKTQIANPQQMDVKPQVNQRKNTVLFVDDDTAIVTAMSLLLDTKGFVVFTAQSGEAAIALVQNGLQPNIVLTDYRLPGCNGLELVDRLRHLMNRKLPAIIMTGDTAIQHNTAENLACCTVLYKPVNTRHLLALLTELSASG